MKTDPLAAFAAWPTTAEEATAEALIRYAAVRAQGAYALLLTGRDDARQATRVTQYVTMTQLLRALNAADPERADRTARLLWSRLGDGSDVPAVIEWWLIDAGIDADDVAKAAVDAYEARTAAAAAETASDAEGQVGAR